MHELNDYAHNYHFPAVFDDIEEKLQRLQVILGCINRGTEKRRKIAKKNSDAFAQALK